MQTMKSNTLPCLRRSGVTLLSDDAEAAGLENSGNHANATLMAGAMGGGPGRYGQRTSYSTTACLSDLGGNEVDLADEWTIAVWFKTVRSKGVEDSDRGGSRDHQLIVHVDNNPIRDLREWSWRLAWFKFLHSS